MRRIASYQSEALIVGHSGRDEQNEVLHARTIAYLLAKHLRPRVPQTCSVTLHSHTWAQFITGWGGG